MQKKYDAAAWGRKRGVGECVEIFQIALWSEGVWVRGSG